MHVIAHVPPVHVPPAHVHTSVHLSNPVGGLKKLRPYVGPKARLAITIVCTFVATVILCLKLVSSPDILSKSGNVSLVPHTSLAVTISGLYCESLVLSREAWDGSEASNAWDAYLYVLPEPPSFFERYNFTISNENVIATSC